MAHCAAHCFHRIAFHYNNHRIISNVAMCIGSSIPRPCALYRQFHFHVRRGGGCPKGGCYRNFSPIADNNKHEIAIIGLGNMGFPMMNNLLLHHKQNGSPTLPIISSVIAYDANSHALEKADMAGATCVSSIHELVNNHGHSINYIITMLPNCSIVKNVTTELVEALQRKRGDLDGGIIFVDCSTISPSTASVLHQLVTSAGHERIDAPVSGGVKGAESATLTFMVGAKLETLDRTAPLLRIMGKNVVHCGDAGMGLVAKLCNNLALASQMVGIAEAMNLGTSLGIDPKTLANVMNISTAKCWSCEMNNPHPEVASEKKAPASRNYQGGFASALMLKDVNLAVNTGDASNVALPVGNLAREIYKLIIARGDGGKDFGTVLQFLQGK